MKRAFCFILLALSSCGPRVVLRPELIEAYDPAARVRRLASLGYVNQQDAQGRTPLRMAIERGDDEEVKALLARGADANLADSSGLTPLMAGALSGNGEILTYLLEAHAKVNAQNKQGWTALMIAAWQGRSWMVDALVGAGADPNLENQDHESAYVKAGQAGNQDLMQKLKNYGARVKPVFLNKSLDPGPELTAAQHWALATAAILVQSDTGNLDLLGYGPPEAASEQRESLATWWEIYNREDVIENLNRLLEHGKREQFMAMGGAFATLSDAEVENYIDANNVDQVAAERIRFAKKYYAKLGSRGILAFDLCRVIYVASCAYRAGYLSEEEAWRFILPVAKRIQRNFYSWQDMGENYLLGREFWRGERNEGRDFIFKLLLNPEDPNSPWNQYPWRTDLSSTWPGPAPQASQAVLPHFYVPMHEELEQLAAKGFPRAEYHYAQSCFAQPWENKKEGLAWLEKAASHGYVLAQLEMGRRYYQGDGVRQDYPRSFAWYEKAALQGEAEAEFWLGYLYNGVPGIEADGKKSIAWLERAAPRYPWALVQLGREYEMGKVVAKDLDKALLYYRRASEAGVGEGWAELGRLYYFGIGTKQNYQTAAQCWAKGAQRGDANAMARLGNLYYGGLAVTKNAATGFLWALAAAQQGDAFGQYQAGMAYADGNGTTPNAEQGLHWLTLAANQNYEDALLTLGYGYYKGLHGLPVDYDKSIAWYKEAADQGSTWGQANLADMLARGEGVAKSLSAASEVCEKYLGPPNVFPWIGATFPIYLSSGQVRINGDLTPFKRALSAHLDCTDKRHLVYQACDAKGLSADIYVMLDRQFLYVGARVKQGRPPLNRQSGDQLWDGDSVEIFICSRPDYALRSRKVLTPWDQVILLAPTSKNGSPVGVFGFGGIADSREIRVAAKSDAQGYQLSTAIPLADLPGLEDAKPGTRLRFDVDVEEARPDGKGRARKIFWHQTSDDVSNPDNWGIAEVQ